MLSALVGFVIAAVIIGLVAWVPFLLWDWVFGIPGPIPQIVRVVIIVVAVVAILYRLMPLAGRI